MLGRIGFKSQDTEDVRLTKRLTNRELDIMAILWRDGAGTVNEVSKGLDDDLAYSTVLTMLRTLESKGHVRHESEGKAHRFYPITQPEDAGGGALDRVLDKMYQGSRELLVTRLLADEEVSPEELKRIRELLDERLRELES
jgi:predicted transcriptional regulator